MIDWLHGLNTAGRRVQYSIGWAIGEAERMAITALPTSAWSPALDADGDLRQAAEVAELTGLVHLPGWPAGMRVIVRRERPHPGAQLSLFEEADGWRYTAFVTNAGVGIHGIRGSCMARRPSLRNRRRDARAQPRSRHRSSRAGSSSVARLELASVRGHRPLFILPSTGLW